MTKSNQNLIKLLSLIVIFSMHCSIFTPEYEQQLYREATETTLAQQYTPIPATDTPVPKKENINPGVTPTTEEQAAGSSEEKICKWFLIETTEALSTGGDVPGMSAKGVENGIATSYTHAGNMGCGDQIFETTHYWVGLYDSLYPGVENPLTVYFVWNLEGQPECTSLTAGGKTAVTIETKIIEIGQSTINVSAEPDGDLSQSGLFVLPDGVEGDQYNITASGSTGALGGSIFYVYEYQCFVP